MVDSSEVAISDTLWWRAYGGSKDILRNVTFRNNLIFQDMLKQCHRCRMFIFNYTFSGCVNKFNSTIIDHPH